MAKYLIHTCEDRQWYVNDFLIPSMLAQGIDKDNISVYTDTEHLGNLQAYVQSLYLMDFDKGTWHLQDDIVISKQFKRWTEEYDDGIVCGFCNIYSEQFPMGVTEPRMMWYSFQCMRIPDVIAKEFATWFYHETQYNEKFANWAKNFHDDYVFRVYMERNWSHEQILNLAPNIVEHIDYLLGGSIINKKRGDLDVKSIHWNEEDVVKQLEIDLYKYWEEKIDAGT